MAINFPTSPVLNQEYTFDTKTWIWNGAAWALKQGQPSNLLDLIKTVDGTGSGLDADLVDGTHASSFYLASNPNGYTSNTGTVTSVGATSPVVSSGGTSPTISIPPATASTSGYMTTAYASKLDGIAAGATNVTNTNQLVNGAGYVTGNGSGASGTWNISISGSAASVPTRVITIASASTLTLNCDTTDLAVQNNTGTGTLTVTMTGTPTDGQKIMIRLTSTNILTFSWDAVFLGSIDVPLPTTSTGGSKEDYIGFIYDAASSKWHLIAKNFGF